MAPLPKVQYPTSKKTISTDIGTQADRYDIIAATEAITNAGIDFEALALDHIGDCIGSAHPDIYSFQIFISQSELGLLLDLLILSKLCIRH